jgi:hypothetical protein
MTASTGSREPSLQTIVSPSVAVNSGRVAQATAARYHLSESGAGGIAVAWRV